MDEEGHLLIILHQVPEPEHHEQRYPFLLWCNPEGEWKSSPNSGGLSGLKDHLVSYEKKIHALDEDVETADSPHDFFKVMKSAHPLLRATRNKLAILETLRKARRGNQQLIVMRDRAIDLERMIEMVTNDAKVGMEFSVAMSAEEQALAANQSSNEAKRLNRLVAFFFPLATVASIFGMSPAQEVIQSPNFWTVLMGSIAAGIITGALILGKKNQ